VTTEIGIAARLSTWKKRSVYVGGGVDFKVTRDVGSKSKPGGRGIKKCSGPTERRTAGGEGEELLIVLVVAQSVVIGQRATLEYLLVRPRIGSLKKEHCQGSGSAAK